MPVARLPRLITEPEQHRKHKQRLMMNCRSSSQKVTLAQRSTARIRTSLMVSALQAVSVVKVLVLAALQASTQVSWANGVRTCSGMCNTAKVDMTPTFLDQAYRLEAKELVRLQAEAHR